MIEGLSRREAAKRFGIDRRTVAKMLEYSVPPCSVETSQANGTMMRISPFGFADHLDHAKT